MMLIASSGKLANIWQTLSKTQRDNKGKYRLKPPNIFAFAKVLMVSLADNLRENRVGVSPILEILAYNGA
jgi:hypothetical protein